MASGLIAAALGGFGKGLATVGEMEAKRQNEAKLRKEMLAAESEARLREDEITRGRAFDYQKRDISELEPLRTSAAVTREKALIPVAVEKEDALIPSRVKQTTQVGKAQTGVEKEREEELREGKVKTREAETTAETKALVKREEALQPLRMKWEKDLADVKLGADEKKTRMEAQVLMDLGNNKKYLAALAKIADAKTSQAEKTQAAAAAYKIKNEKTVSDLRTQLSRLPDTPENANARGELRRQIEDLTDKKIGSYSDVAGLANSYLVASNTILRNGTDTEEERAEAKRLRELGESLGRGIVEKRLPGADKSPAPSSTAYKVGEERILSTGANKGKTVVWDGKQWNVKK